MKYNTIVVLAGGVRANGELPDTVKKRIDTAKELYDNGLAPCVLMSGRWSLFRDTVPACTEAESMKLYALSIGIPATAILKEESSHNTTTNAWYTLKQYLEPNNWKKLIVVTSSFHLVRAKYIFQTLLGSAYDIRYVAAPVKSDSFTTLRWTLNEILSLFLTKLHFTFHYK